MKRMDMRVLGVLLGVGGAVAATLAPASAASPVVPPAPREAPAPRGDFPEDVLAVAADHGIPAREAQDLLEWENRFALAATSASDNFPDAFAGAAILDPLGHIAEIRFKGDAPPEALEAIARSGDLGTVRVVTEEPFTSREQDAMVVAVHYDLLQSGLVEDSLTTYFDDANQRVVVEASPRQPALGMQPAGDVNPTIQERSSALAGANVEVRIVAPVRAVEDARNGGGWLDINGYGCTAGFNALHSSGVRGVVTAGHCENSPGVHYNYSGQPSWTLTYKTQHLGAWGDFQWHTSTDSIPDDFYYNSSHGLRDVTAVANPVDNQTLCRYGRATGTQCDEVTELSVCNGSYCRLVEMAHREANGGDSGGPWYSGTTAYGYHEGAVRCGSLGQNECDVWSRATYLDDALGLYVSTF